MNRKKVIFTIATGAAALLASAQSFAQDTKRTYKCELTKVVGELCHSIAADERPEYIYTFKGEEAAVFFEKNKVLKDKEIWKKDLPKTSEITKITVTESPDTTTKRVVKINQKGTIKNRAKVVVEVKEVYKRTIIIETTSDKKIKSKEIIIPAKDLLCAINAAARHTKKVIIKEESSSEKLNHAVNSKTAQDAAKIEKNISLIAGNLQSYAK